uniref:Uncharacterized protein n=1 Tax=Panagrellus redivivus TaxID=6233 RepID=A0A7E4VNL5_PANRE
MSKTPVKAASGTQCSDDFTTPHRKPSKMRPSKAIDFDDDVFETPIGSTPGITDRSDDSGIGGSGILDRKIAKVTPMPRVKALSSKVEPPVATTQRLGHEGAPSRHVRHITIPVTPHFILPTRCRPLTRVPSPPRAYRTPPMSPSTRKAIIEAVVERLYKPKYRNDPPAKMV